MSCFRVVIVALCLAGIATMLQGCGGDGNAANGHGVGPPVAGCAATASKDKCMCTSFDIATGTSKGTIKANGIMLVPGPDGVLDVPVEADGELTLMIDMDNLNARVDMTGSGQDIATGTSKGTIEGQSSKVKIIVDSEKAVMVQHIAQAGKPAYCMITPLPPAQVLKTQVDQARTMSDTFLKCKGNDGTFDSWHVDQSGPGGLGQEVKADAIIKSDNRHHLKSISMTANDISPSAKSAKLDAFFTVSDNGPTAADLDYSTWGCKQGPGPSQDPDVLQQDFLTTLSAHHPMLAVLASIRQTAIASQTKETTSPSAEGTINI